MISTKPSAKSVIQVQLKYTTLVKAAVQIKSRTGSALEASFQSILLFQQIYLSLTMADSIALNFRQWCLSFAEVYFCSGSGKVRWCMSGFCHCCVTHNSIDIPTEILFCQNCSVRSAGFDKYKA